MSKYFLIVDDEEDLLELHTMTVNTVYTGTILTAKSGNSAVKIIEEKGEPEVVLCDNQMPDGEGSVVYNLLKAKYPNVPFVLCSATPEPQLKKLMPDYYALIEKPSTFDRLADILREIFQKNGTQSTVASAPPAESGGGTAAPAATAATTERIYVPIRISLLLRLGFIRYELHLKLASDKFVRVANADETFQPEDALRFLKKGVGFLHLTTDDAVHFIKEFENTLILVNQNYSGTEEDVQILALESIESVQRLSAAFGWTENVVRLAKQSVDLAIRAISTKSDLMAALTLRLKNSGSMYSQHISNLTIVCCALSKSLGWGSDFTQVKLAMAALMHDISIAESYYEDIGDWNGKARDKKNTSPEVVKYRSHPQDAAKAVLTLKDLPPDIDQILLQHHELPDGSGFPQGIGATKISPLATLFIVAEDLVNYIGASENVKEKVDQFVIDRAELYSTGNFRKVLSAIGSQFSENQS